MNINMKKFFIFFLFFLCLPTLSFAEDFLVEIFVDAKNEPVNAVGGKLSFNRDILEVKEIRDGNSLINFWVEKPSEKNGEITFSGITPGGLYGSKNLLFGIIFYSKGEGDRAIKLSEITTLKNEGKSALAEAIIQITEQIQVSKTEDTEPPESFKPAVASDPEIFNGKYFLVFTTQDKNSGIDHYKIREGFFGKYVIAESPYLLENQSLNKKIYVKAVDRAGNEKIAVFSAVKWYQQYALFGIILLLIITGGFAFKKIWPKFTTK